MNYTYEYPRPMLTVDVALICVNPTNNHRELLVIKRKNEPFKDQWALPGGYVEENETVEEAAIREFLEETSIILQIEDLVQLSVKSDPNRDPRGWTISVPFVAYFDNGYVYNVCHDNVKASDDAKEHTWIDIDNVCFSSLLAFDHDDIVEEAIAKCI